MPVISAIVPPETPARCPQHPSPDRGQTPLLESASPAHASYHGDKIHFFDHLFDETLGCRSHHHELLTFATHGQDEPASGCKLFQQLVGRCSAPRRPESDQKVPRGPSVRHRHAAVARCAFAARATACGPAPGAA